MGRQGVLGRVAIVVLVGYIAVCSAEYQYARNYGAELSDIERQIPVEAGLAWGYYAQSCPNAESIVSASVAASLKKDGGVAAGLVRIIFHDCFVQGCDGSILLKLASGSELNAPPNLSIRPVALQLVDDVKNQLEKACPKVVSCSDIVVLAAKVAVQLTGGPTFNVPLGRRDALNFKADTTGDLPGPFTTFAEQQAIFKNKGLTDTADIVALAGAHTLGVAHCNAFNSRLLPTVDPKLNSNYASYLINNVCPTLQSSNATGLDFFTPNKFDNIYFTMLLRGGALMTSDQNLDQDSTAWNLVNNWAKNQDAFFNQFVTSFVKMSQITTLTGNKGEIRKTCSTTNSGKVNVPVDKPDFISMVTDGKTEV